MKTNIKMVLQINNFEYLLEMNKIESIYSELKYLNDQPKVFLLKQFDEIRYQIDIECQKFLNALNFLYLNGLEIKTIEQQLEMLSEVDLFQKQCLAKFAQNPPKQLNLEELDQRIKSINSEDKDVALKLEKELYKEMFNRKKCLFGNKGIVFLSMENCKHFFQHYVSFGEPRILFGTLILIEDEFLLFGDKLQQFIE